MNDSEEAGAASMFPRDDETAALHREASALKENGDWDGAIAKLAAAKTRMLTSSVSYPVATWCRLAVFLQYAGRYEESMQEFDFLLGDLSRRKRAELIRCRLGSDEVKRAIAIHQQLFKRERQRVETREMKRVKKLATGKNAKT